MHYLQRYDFYLFFLLCFLCFSKEDSLFHSVKYKNHSVEYIFHTVGYKSRTVGQRICKCVGSNLYKENGICFSFKKTLYLCARLKREHLHAMP